MTIFAHHYREHSLPVLKGHIAVLAARVCIDEMEYDEAFELLLSHADKLGRWMLERKEMADLDQWLLANLSSAVADAQTRADAMQRSEIVDPVRYYESLAEGCLRPDAMRWAFAAINPTYREHLIAQQRANHARPVKRAA